MRAGLLAFVLFVCVVIEMTLLDVIAVAGIRPSLLMIVALFVALWAPRSTALWSCFLIGLLIDLTAPIAYASWNQQHLPGPHALGLTFAAAFSLQLRAMLMRRQVFAFAVMMLIFAITASVVVVSVLTARSLFPTASPELAGYGPLRDLGQRCVTALYTAVVSIPFGWLLLRTIPAWRFQSAVSAGSAAWR
ncbi:MAG: hypothetical protein ACR2GY_08750 [Phycisphaerales bacterium]